MEANLPVGPYLSVCQEPSGSGIAPTQTSTSLFLDVISVLVSLQAKNTTFGGGGFGILQTSGGEGYCGPWIENRWIKHFLEGLGATQI